MTGAALAFVGTVQSLGQSPEPGVAADERTALVHVEQALQAPPSVDISPGSAVVVQLAADAPVLEPGERATFFAEPLVYGNTLVVREVDRRGEGEPARTAAAAATPEEDAVLEHARAADAVVRAQVTALRAAGGNPQHEHDPQWWIATFDVDVVAQGDIEEGEAEVLYANSLDRRWRRSPKPKAGEGGMWILHRTEGELTALAPWRLEHPEDLQPSVVIDDLLGEADEDEDEAE